MLLGFLDQGTVNVWGPYEFEFHIKLDFPSPRPSIKILNKLSVRELPDVIIWASLYPPSTQPLN